MLLDRLRYELRVMGKRVVLTPILVMLGFAVLAELLSILHTNSSNIARVLMASLEMILPIAAGVVVATISTQDPAIELQLTMPRKYHMTALRRLSLIIGWTTLIALLSSVIIDLFHLEWKALQLQSYALPLQFLLGLLAWIAPMLWYVAVGLCLALLIRSRSASGALLGGIWIAEVLFKDFFLATSWLHPFFLFPTTLQPEINFWLTNRLELIITALVLLPLGWLLLHNTEGLLKGASEE